MSKLSQIWVLKTKAGISEGDFRMLCLGATGMESTKAMSEVEREKVVKAIFLAHPELKKGKQTKKSNRHGLPFLPTIEQKAKAAELERSLHQTLPGTGITLDTQATRMYGKPFSKLDGRQVQGVIESLKAILKRGGSSSPLKS